MTKPSLFVCVAFAALAMVSIQGCCCSHSDHPTPPSASVTIQPADVPAPVAQQSVVAVPATTEATAAVVAAADDVTVNGPVLLTVHAHGIQIYSRPTGAGDEVPWKFKAPDAEFASDDGVKGKHYAGPTWETEDGTKVVGEKVAQQASPDPNAVPWLLIKVVSHEGNGPISTATYIKRINTTGGKLPDGYPTVGDETHVPYTADYVFYGPGATTHP